MRYQTPTATTAARLPAFILAALLLGLSVLLAGCGGDEAGAAADTQSSEQPVYEPPTEGTAIDPPRELMDFTLPDQDGEPLSLSDLRGKPTLIYFGYTYCPDVCPTTLADLMRAKRQLGELGDEVNILLISVDAQRDTSEVLKKYLGNFDEDFIGVSADTDTLRQIGADYGLYVRKREIEGTSADYLIDHSANTYFVDAEGRLIMLYGYGIPAEVVAADVQDYLEDGEL
jgi:protein SCO1/2